MVAQRTRLSGLEGTSKVPTYAPLRSSRGSFVEFWIPQRNSSPLNKTYIHSEDIFEKLNVWMAELRNGFDAGTYAFFSGADPDDEGLEGALGGVEDDEDQETLEALAQLKSETV